LSQRYDIRPLVVETLLTYMQLDGLLESTGAFYSAYKFRWVKSQSQVLAKFERSRADFLQNVLSLAKLGKTWFAIDVAAAAERLHEPRQRVVTALSYLDEQGDIVLEATGVRQGFRRLQRDIAAPAVAAKMTERFAGREKRDLERLQSVIDYCQSPGCKTRKLLDYFGESLPKDCGHCATCRSANAGDARATPATTLPKTESAAPSKQIANVAAQLHSSAAGRFLKSSRAMAKFLCGISSPIFTRQKLTKDRRFGQFENVPFKEVMRAVG
jgi:ATP-dependent DNA helicase RecQ